MKNPKTTHSLTGVLEKTGRDGLSSFFDEYQASFFPAGTSFREELLQLMAQKKMTRRTLFLKAGIPESYGYKLLSGETGLDKRDTLLRMCFAVGCDSRQTDRLLKLNGMEPLYVRRRRDVVLLTALQSGLTDPEEVDRMLRRYGEPPLDQVGQESED